MHTDGIGIDDEGSLTLAEGHKTELLLKQTEQEPKCNADNGTNGRNHAALKEEYLCDLPVARPEIA